MKLATTIPTITLLSNILHSHAWPIIPEQRRREPQLAPRAPASYSVVAVDGGSTTTTAPTTQTITQPPITTTLTSTLLSTSIISVSGSVSPQTVVVTITSTLATTLLQTVAPTTIMAATTLTQPTSVVQTVQESFTETMTDTATASSTAEAVVTVTMVPSSTPFDDGMWHTTYYHPVVPSATESSAVSAAPATGGNSTVVGYRARVIRLR